ncbi:cobalt ABC transporter permease [Tropicimonas marinistellae]|uniref:cobalt ABC transporter permease n=1 Tax=Tropicimonas marinistellae TaxID=1739787 RepID=UPI00082B58F3|nr:cobalt ABC transporter permease [Tropicimonas marinistellae]
MIRAVCLALSLALLPLPAVAHKVVMGVFPSGTQIEGELGFSSGDTAKEGTPIEVFDENGTKLGETVTDADGFFVFTPRTAVTHVFRANLGAGHVGEATMPADEVAALLGTSVVGAAASSVANAAAPETPGAAATIAIAAEPNTAQLTSAPPALGADDIARIVRDEMRPLRKEIAAYKEKNDLQSILGGIGYIVGLFGLGFYVAARHRLRSAT